MDLKKLNEAHEKLKKIAFILKKSSASESDKKEMELILSEFSYLLGGAYGKIAAYEEIFEKLKIPFK
jgi:hypothetical protein